MSSYIEVSNSPIAIGKSISVVAQTKQDEYYGNIKQTHTRGCHFQIVIDVDWTTGRGASCRGGMLVPQNCDFEFKGSPKQLIKLVKDDDGMFIDSRFTMLPKN